MKKLDIIGLGDISVFLFIYTHTNKKKVNDPRSSANRVPKA